MNAVVKIHEKPMLLDMMADRAGLRPKEFADTVRATCGMAKASAEEFAAFLMVAKEYNLNPLTKEIYAFPAKGGGIVPVVSIDGWVNLVNSHAACDGFEFDVEHDEKGELVAITCRMFRKDRSRPVVVTEYYDECKRGTDPWKMKHRMLRHKAMIQAARYAFGFSGIYDEDEGAKIADMREINPQDRPTPPKPPAPPSASKPVENFDAVTGEVIEDAEIVRETGEDTAALSEFNATDFFEEMETSFAAETTAEGVEDRWTEFDPLAQFEGDDINQGIALAIKKRALKRIGG